MASKKLMQGFCVNLEGGVFGDMPFNSLEYFRRYVFGFIPMLFIPLLKGMDWWTHDLDIKLDIFGQTGATQI